MKRINFLPSLGVLTAFTSSLCCILPVFAFLAGASGLASNFLWLDPARPYFIGSTLLTLSLAWYQKLKPQKQVDCNCDEHKKVSFWQSKNFLAVVTSFSFLLLSFPSYAHLFFPKSENKITVSQLIEIRKIQFTISGMTCTGCEHHVKSEISKLKGIKELTVSYQNGSAIVGFDSKQTTVEAIIKAINSTGYKVVKHTIVA
ncbi:MAG: mercuric transport protein MerTP [Rudanella sp.]|nr:mercuric transport protein MerTP [Rudanella sp.]